MSDEDDIFGGPPLDLSWQDIGRLNQDGYVDTQPVGDDPRIFEDQFERRSREKERQPPNLQPVTVVPNRAGPWSGNNQLGIEQPFAPDANNRQTILKLDEWGFPQVWTVCLGVDYDAQNTPLLNLIDFEVTALLQFGIGGVVQEVEVDWKNGATISLPFNALNVIALYNIIVGARSTSTIPDSLRLRASLSRGSLQNSEPTRSFSFRNDTLLDVDLPKFAKSLLICPADSNSLTPFQFYTQDWEVHFRTNEIGVQSAAVYKISQCVSWLDVASQMVGGPMFLPVPPYARRVQVLTSLGVDVTDEATFIFKLAF